MNAFKDRREIEGERTRSLWVRQHLEDSGTSDGGRLVLSCRLRQSHTILENEGFQGSGSQQN